MSRLFDVVLKETKLANIKMSQHDSADMTEANIKAHFIPDDIR